MANVLQSKLSTALSKLEGLLGTPVFYYRNGKYPCIPTTERRGNLMELGGTTYEVSLSLIIRKDAIPGAITVDDTEVSVDWNAADVIDASAGADPAAISPFASRRVGRKNKLYRILSVREDSTGSHWSIDLADARV